MLELCSVWIGKRCPFFYSFEQLTSVGQSKRYNSSKHSFASPFSACLQYILPLDGACTASTLFWEVHIPVRFYRTEPPFLSPPPPPPLLFIPCRTHPYPLPSFPHSCCLPCRLYERRALLCCLTEVEATPETGRSASSMARWVQSGSLGMSLLASVERFTWLVSS